MRSLVRVLVPAMLLVTVPAGAQAPPAPAAGGQPGALGEAITFAPPDTRAIAFDDWAAMKAAHGLSGVTSATPIAERLDALQTLTAEEGPFSVFSMRDFVGFAEAWGWDLTDLDWESASVSEDHGWVSVVRLPVGYDVDPIVARYDDRGFTVELYDDAVIRSQTGRGTAWSVAFLDDDRTLVFARDPEAVKAALDARHIQTFRASPLSVVAEMLDAPLSAEILVGAETCATFDPRIAEHVDPRNIAALDAAGTLLDWEAMGISTGRTTDGDPAGRFVFAYGDPADALGDLAGRTLLAQQGVSLQTRRPIPESLFTLDRVDVGSSTLVLDVIPADGRNRRLSDAFEARDLVFATCG